MAMYWKIHPLGKVIEDLGRSIVGEDRVDPVCAKCNEPDDLELFREQIKKRRKSSHPLKSKLPPEKIIKHLNEFGVLNTASESPDSATGIRAQIHHGSKNADETPSPLYWFEVDRTDIGLDPQDANSKRYVPCDYGPSSSRWYRGIEFVTDKTSAGTDVADMANPSYADSGEDCSYAITWNSDGTGNSFRLDRTSSIAGTNDCLTLKDGDESLAYGVLGLLNSDVVKRIIDKKQPAYTQEQLSATSLTRENALANNAITVRKLIKIFKDDWDQNETSINFAGNPLVRIFREIKPSGLKWKESRFHFVQQQRVPDELEREELSAKFDMAVVKLQDHFKTMIADACALEPANNDANVKALLGHSITPSQKILPAKIQLGCNPYYTNPEVAEKNELNYTGGLTGMITFPPPRISPYTQRLANAGPKLRYQQSTLMRDLISYAVGCMLGRYSLDTPGLICGGRNGVSGSKSPDQQIHSTSNILPITPGNFKHRFETFISSAFLGGSLKTESVRNIYWNIEQLLKLDELINVDDQFKSIDDYILNGFYADHLIRYHYRPIYWLFRSPKGYFRALVYLHRCDWGICRKLYDDYLMPYYRRLKDQESYILEHEAKKVVPVYFPDKNGSQPIAGRIIYQSNNVAYYIQTESNDHLDAVREKLADLEYYMNEIIKPLMVNEPDIDLSEGIVANYKKFRKALAPLQ